MLGIRRDTLLAVQRANTSVARGLDHRQAVTEVIRSLETPIEGKGKV